MPEQPDYAVHAEGRVTPPPDSELEPDDDAGDGEQEQ